MRMQRPIIDRNELLDHLNREVYGQKWAKEKLTDTLVWNQILLQHIRAGVLASDLPPKANLMLIGPTGVGKTLLAQTAAKFCKLPCFCTNADNYSAPGYHGADVDSMVEELLKRAGGSVAAAEGGIIHIDEVDKIRRRDLSGADVGGESVQNGLLTLVQGKVVTCGLDSVDTSNITIIVGGAFTSISARIGPDGQRQFEAEELVRFGMIPEFVGRFPLRVGLSPLTADDLRALLLECRSSTLCRTRNLFQMHGMELVVDDQIIDSIIANAQRMGTGARSLDEMLKDRCLGLMNRVWELEQKGLKRIIVRKDGIVEEKACRASVLPEPARKSLPTQPSREAPVRGPERTPPADSDDLLLERPKNSTETPGHGEVTNGQGAMTAKGWTTIALAFILLALGLGAYRSLPARASNQGSTRSAEERVIKGEETPRLWRELQRGRSSK